MKVVILAGGGGTRLFPLSRESRPKQFLNIDDNKSLLVHTIERFRNICQLSDIIIVTNKKYQYHVQNEVALCGAQDVHILLEPVPRNTAPAIALAAKYCQEVLGCDGDEVLFVSTSDHIIRPNNVFSASVEEANILAAKGNVVTFGITPTYPATGFGYLEAVTAYQDTEAFEAGEVKEKPDIETAQKYVEAGNFYWNSGMFAFTVQCYFEELEKYHSDILDYLQGSYTETVQQFLKMPNISVDYAIAEKSSRIVILPLKLYWNDVGSWDAIHDVLAKDAKGNAFKGDCIAIDCKNSLMVSNGRLITGIGLENLTIVETPDVVLVSQKGEAQKVRDLVDELKKRGRKEATEHTTLYYSWGSYTLLGEGPGYRMKKLIINPGAKVKAHLHYHRSEHWIVASGTGKVSNGDEVRLLHENEGEFCPIGVMHAIENPGKIPLEVIEVQSGRYLEADDIKYILI